MADKKKVSTIEELLKWVQELENLKSLKCGDFIYRGQCNLQWLLKSEAVRRIPGPKIALTDQYPKPEEVEDYILTPEKSEKKKLKDDYLVPKHYHGGTLSSPHKR